MHKKNLKRRTFITGSVGTVAGLMTAGSILSNKKSDSYADEASIEESSLTASVNEEYYGSAFDSPPILQNYSETSVCIVFAVNAKSGNPYYHYANSQVTYWKKGASENDKITVKCGGYRMTDMHDKIQRICLVNLSPSTEYEFQIYVDRVSYKDGNNIKIDETFSETSEIFTFKTAGDNVNSHFCVINDTHHNKNSSFAKCFNKIKALTSEPSCILLNGDLTDAEPSLDKLIEVFCKPEVGDKDSLSKFPFLLCPGEQEQKGLGSVTLQDVWLNRLSDERKSEHWDLSRNFAVRIGDIALIGLDTGLDTDEDDSIMHVYNNNDYRKAQREWLEYALNLDRIKEAPFLIAACHIPLYENPTNDGFNDNLKLTFRQDCYDLWNDLLTESKCCLLLAGHTHKYRSDLSVSGSSWIQIVGGGNSDTDSEQYPTVLDVYIKEGSLHVDAYECVEGNLKEQIVINPKGR